MKIFSFCLIMMLLIQLAATEMEPKVIGGSEAPVGRYSSVVPLLLTSDGSHRCGATLIAENWAVTAAHCVGYWEGPTDPQNLKIVVGRHDLNSTVGQEIQIKTIIVHEDYAGYIHEMQQENDIALLELSTSVSDKHALILSEQSTELAAPGRYMMVAGWGYTQEWGAKAIKLMHVSVPVVTENQCAQAYSSGTKAGEIDGRVICAGLTDGGRDACTYDSGGPLYAITNSGKPVLAGIVSWGVGCARAEKYGVYTRITYYRDWIKSHTGPLEEIEASEIPDEIIVPDDTNESQDEYIDNNHTDRTSLPVDINETADEATHPDTGNNSEDIESQKNPENQIIEDDGCSLLLI